LQSILLSLDPSISLLSAAVGDGSGTKYTAIAIHKDESDCEAHKKMGFHDGWGKAFDQLVQWANIGSL
jgi:uncharacterized protein YndB with AHSA1/START domain